MKQYDKFSVSDFIMDDYFLKWVKNPSAEVEEFWSHWLKLNPDKKEEVARAKHVILSIDFKKTVKEEIDTSQILDRIRKTIKEDIRPEKIADQKRLYLWSSYGKMAAVVSGLVLISIVLLIIIRSASIVKVTTSYGETKQLTLPDQSVVTLNANSTLKYEKEWKEDEPRQVWVDGEAFFEVKKTNDRLNPKFIVNTGSVMVEVLGTKFNVKNRHGNTKVVLNTGKVRLKSMVNTQEEVTMIPGEMAEIKEGSDKFYKKIVDPELYTSWKDEKLIFRHTSFKEITKLIEDNYGYKVENNVEGLDHTTFTASIPTSQLDVLLEALQITYNVQIVKEKNKIIFKME